MSFLDRQAPYVASQLRTWCLDRENTSVYEGENVASYRLNVQRKGVGDSCVIVYNADRTGKEKYCAFDWREHDGLPLTDVLGPLPAGCLIIIIQFYDEDHDESALHIFNT